jgi:hypothetical protein
MRVVFAATLIAALQLASAMPAAASGIASYAQTQASSPVQVVGCSTGLEHINSGFGTDFYRLNMFAQFKNESSKVAVAVLIRFQLSNAFGDVLDNRYGESSGQFSPDVEIDGQKWSNEDIWAGLSVVRCSVSRVLFVDGSTWRDLEGPAPGSS